MYYPTTIYTYGNIVICMLKDDLRRIRAYSILAKGDIPVVVNEETFLVPSQSSDNRYKVTKIDGWSCECKDFISRKQICKHIYTIQFWLKLRDGIGQNELMQLDSNSEDEKCTYCKSSNIVRNGNRNIKSGIRQRYLCNDCKKRFVIEPIKHIKGNSKIVTLTMDLFFKGLSLRDITDTIKQFYGLELHHETVRRWIMRFTEMANEYTNKLQPKLSKTWHTDEQMVKVKGKWLWNWNVLDSDTRFLIASNVTKGREIKDARKVFQKTKEITENNPDTIITDGLFLYGRAIKKEFAPRRTATKHVRLRTIKEKPDNNRIERFHNTFREFDKVRRGFKTEHTAQGITDGFRTYYNFIRPHMGISNMTPSKMAGIDLNLDGNRWLNLIKLAKENENLEKPKPKGRVMYIIEVYDSNKKKIEYGHGLRTRYTKKEMAEQDLEMYRKAFPEYGFEIKEVEL